MKKFLGILDLGSGFIGLQYSNFCDSLTEGQNEK